MSADATFKTCVETVERTYEFMLAYAAQGRDKEGVGGDGPSIRGYLTDLSGALGRIDAEARDDISAAGADAGAFTAYADVLKDDAARAKAAVDLVLAMPVITSLLIDNLNATIHLRALLTSVFVLDEALDIAKRG